MPTYRVGASLYAVQALHGGQRSIGTGGAANTAGTSYGLQEKRKGSSPVDVPVKVRSLFVGELTIVVPNATRGLISFAELETPIIVTRGRVSFSELEVPNVATRGRVSFAEQEVPFRATRGRVSFSELEVPNALTRGRVSFTELEIPNKPTRGQASFTELEIPLVATRGRLSFTEFEIPDVAAPDTYWNAVSGVSGLSGGGEMADDF